MIFIPSKVATCGEAKANKYRMPLLCDVQFIEVLFFITEGSFASIKSSLKRYVRNIGKRKIWKLA